MPRLPRGRGPKPDGWLVEARPFSLLDRLYHDPVILESFSERSIVEGWLAFERALAQSQAELGILTAEEAAEIDRAARFEAVDIVRLWDESRIVGYPILPLIEQIGSLLDLKSSANIHFGATTQDAMDSGVAIQLGEALDRLQELVSQVGEVLVGMILSHSETIMAARTHAQIAVPTTLGVKLAVFLAEFTRHRTRIEQLRPRVCRVSLFGAGGTAAALGSMAPHLRKKVAERLGLSDEPVPWHVSRDGLAEFTGLCTLLAMSAVRFANEVIDLSRPEIGELSEARGHHRGASSTMPQKDNPILSEAIVGLGAGATSAAISMIRSLEVEHERAAGEWQNEWDCVPRSACLAAAALLTLRDLIGGLEVYPERMAANLTVDRGSVMSEAYMMAIAPILGKDAAHKLVYTAVRDARQRGVPILEALRDAIAISGAAIPSGVTEIAPSAYLGEADNICSSAIDAWSRQEASMSGQNKP